MDLATNGMKALIFFIRMASGLFLGLTLALSSQEIYGFGTFTFMFIIIICTGATLRVTRLWGLLSSIIILLVLILLAVLIKLYIYKAMTA